MDDIFSLSALGECAAGNWRSSAQRTLGTVCLLLLAASSLGVANAQEVSIETQILMNKADIKDLGKKVKDLGKKVDGLTQQLQQLQQEANVPRAVSAPIDGGVALQDLQAQLKSLGAQIDTLRNAQKDLPAQLKSHETQAAALRTVQKGLSVQVEKTPNSRSGWSSSASPPCLPPGLSCSVCGDSGSCGLSCRSSREIRNRSMRWWTRS